MKRYYEFKEHCDCQTFYDAKEKIIQNYEKELNVIKNFFPLYLNGAKSVNVELITHEFIDDNWHTKFKITRLPDKKDFILLEFIGDQIILSQNGIRITFEHPTLYDMYIVKYEEYLSDRVIIQEFLDRQSNITIIFGEKVMKLEIPCDIDETLSENMIMLISKKYGLFELKRFYLDYLSSLQSTYDLGLETKIEILEKDSDNYIPTNTFVLRNRKVESYLFSVKIDDFLMSAKGKIDSDPEYSIKHLKNGIDLNAIVADLNEKMNQLNRTRKI